jgi:hypothetical protein
MKKTIRIAAITVTLLFCLEVPAHPQEPELQITASPRVQHVTNNGATIEWITNVPASTLVRYGRDYDHLDQTAEGAETGQSHAVQLHNLQSGTLYFYQVVSSANRTRAITPVDQFTTTGETVLYHIEPITPASQ